MRLFRLRQEPMGARGERIAVRYLRRRGYRILGRNVHLAGCELDIIARKGDTVAFVEVKTRHGDVSVPPEDCVGQTKRQHIRRAARQYMADHPDPETYYRYDIISVLIPAHGKPVTTHFSDAFPDQ